MAPGSSAARWLGSDCLGRLGGRHRRHPSWGVLEKQYSTGHIPGGP